MQEPRRKPKIEYLSAPLETHGWYMDVAGVSLSHGAENGTSRVGLLLQPSGAPAELTLHLFLSAADAAFLRDALTEILKVYQARQTGSN
jgi:hypothetical protein